MPGELIDVEVAYALPRVQALIALKVEAGATVADAIRRSGITQQFPEIDLRTARVGIFGKVVEADRVLNPGDRVEVYRPMIADAKAARRDRAQRARRGKD